MAAINEAQEFLRSNNIDGWLLYDYYQSNPSLWDIVGERAHLTRPCFYFIPSRGRSVFLVHYVDAGRLGSTEAEIRVFSGRSEMIDNLSVILSGRRHIAMEYSPEAALPRVSRVDGGTFELIRGLGVDIVSSADLLQFTTARWSPEQLETHRSAADKLGRSVMDAFRYIATELNSRPTEYDVYQFIRARFRDEGLEVLDGPIVSVNEHSSDPHYQPEEEGSAVMKRGDWVLIDLWARELQPNSVFADITWVGYIGEVLPKKHREVFEVVAQARDLAFECLLEAHESGKSLQGWQVDQVARDYITGASYGNAFSHRLGHSLGRQVHGEGVNLDNLETHDTRTILLGVGLTIEPGIYLGEFGVRSEIDVYMGEEGPQITTPVQSQVVSIVP